MSIQINGSVSDSVVQSFGKGARISIGGEVTNSVIQHMDNGDIVNNGPIFVGNVRMGASAPADVKVEESPAPADVKVEDAKEEAPQTSFPFSSFPFLRQFVTFPTGAKVTTTVDGKSYVTEVSENPNVSAGNVTGSVIQSAGRSIFVNGVRQGKSVVSKPASS